MASVASQLMEEVTAHAQSDSLEDARGICADGTYSPNSLRISLYYSMDLHQQLPSITIILSTSLVDENTRGTDKSLALPGRKQGTGTKLGIYSTYSPLLSPLL